MPGYHNVKETPEAKTVVEAFPFDNAPRYLLRFSLKQHEHLKNQARIQITGIITSAAGPQGRAWLLDRRQLTWVSRFSKPKPATETKRA